MTSKLGVRMILQGARRRHSPALGAALLGHGSDTAQGHPRRHGWKHGVCCIVCVGNHRHLGRTVAFYDSSLFQFLNLRPHIIS